MNRLLIRILTTLLCLLFGALSTLGVAWACAVYRPTNLTNGHLDQRAIGAEEDNRFENTYTQRAFGHTRRNMIHGRIFVDPERRSVRHLPEPPGAQHPTRELIREEIRVGWPFRSFWCSYEDRVHLDSPNRFGMTLTGTNMTLIGGIEMDATPAAGFQYLRPLPYLPIWPGLVGNIALHSATWGSLLLLLIGSRRLARYWRGRCISCGYDLRGNDAAGCPECGWNRPREESERPDRLPDPVPDRVPRQVPDRVPD